MITTTELIVTLLARPPEDGVDPTDAAVAIARAHGRSLGGRTMEIVASPLSSSDLKALDRLGRPHYGAAFSAAQALDKASAHGGVRSLTRHKQVSAAGRLVIAKLTFAPGAVLPTRAIES